MDNKTVLLVVGSHGIREDGWHGGSSKNEMSSVVFAYSKTGFPLKKVANSEGVLINDNINAVDLAPIIANLIDVPIPFGS